MSKRNWRDIIMVGTVVSLFAGVAVSSYIERKRDAKVDLIMSGEVRGNKESHIFHVPTCPEYESIAPENRRSFETVEAARDVGYRASRNCLEAVEIRESLDHGIEDADMEYDRPY